MFGGLVDENMSVCLIRLFQTDPDHNVTVEYVGRF